MGRPAHLFSGPLLEAATPVAAVVRKRLVEDGHQVREIAPGVEGIHRDARRVNAGLQRHREYCFHVPVVTEESQSTRGQHLGRGAVCGVDRVAESALAGTGEHLRRSCLDPVEKGGSDSPAPARWINDAPGLDDLWLRSPRLPIPKDGPLVVESDPRVSSEVEPDLAPLAAQELRSENDLTSVLEFVRQQYLCNPLEVALPRGAKLMLGRTSHDRRATPAANGAAVGHRGDRRHADRFDLDALADPLQADPRPAGPGGLRGVAPGEADRRRVCPCSGGRRLGGLLPGFGGGARGLVGPARPGVGPGGGGGCRRVAGSDRSAPP